MDKWQALHSFWSGFGLEARDESSVTDEMGFPRLTYEAATASFGDGARPMTASLWYKSPTNAPNWTEISRKSDEISRTIGMGGVMLRYDGGALWIKRGNPFAQRMSDPDSTIRRIVLQIEAEFLSAD